MRTCAYANNKNIVAVVTECSALPITGKRWETKVGKRANTIAQYRNLRMIAGSCFFESLAAYRFQRMRPASEGPAIHQSKQPE